MNAVTHTRNATQVPPTARYTRHGASIAELREEAFIWFRYARFLGISRESAITIRDEAIDFSRRLGAHGFVLPARLTLTGSSIARGTFFQQLKQETFVEVIVRCRSEQDGLDTREYVGVLIDVLPHEAAHELGRLDEDTARWLLPLLRDWQRVRAFASTRKGSTCIVIADVPVAAQEWLNAYEDRKAAAAERIQTAIASKSIAPVYLRRRTEDGRTRLTGTTDAEVKLQTLYDRVERARPGSRHAERLLHEIDMLTAAILHHQHRNLAAQDNELTYLPTVEDWLREETWARDEAGPHRPAYLAELSGRDRCRVAVYH